MQEARLLLRTTTLSIKQIARRSGISDEGYFARVFHQSDGLSPSAFRKLNTHVAVNQR